MKISRTLFLYVALLALSLLSSLEQTYPFSILLGSRTCSSCVQHVIHTVIHRIIMHTTQNLRNCDPPKRRRIGMFASGKNPA